MGSLEVQYKTEAKNHPVMNFCVKEGLMFYKNKF